MECCCPHNSVIEELWVNAVHLMKRYALADGSYVIIYFSLIYRAGVYILQNNLPPLGGGGGKYLK